MPFKFVKPNLIVTGDVGEIDLNALWEMGIQGFIFDLDNTLMAPRVGTLRPHVMDWLSRLNQAGFTSILLTNNKKAEYCKRAAELLNMPVIAHARKPSPVNFDKALQQLDLPASQVAVVGDRPLTDIWGGQRIGAYTILVDPLIKLEEPRYIQFLRALERSVVKAPQMPSR